MGNLHRLFGGTKARDWSGWCLAATTKIVIIAELEGPFAGEPLELAPLAPALAAAEIERLVAKGLRVRVRTLHELVPYRDLDGTAIFVDDMTARERERIVAEMVRAGVPIVAGGAGAGGVTQPPSSSAAPVADGPLGLSARD
jgi:hypothetical protein